MIRARKVKPLIEAFGAYTERYLKGQFHAVHLFGEPPRVDDDGRTPLVACLNHTSWWDVLVGIYVERRLFGREWYGVMDERQLRRYRFFSYLGVIGVDRTSLRGAKEFVDYAGSLLRGQNRTLWVTPQGEMVSNRDRPVTFQGGVGSLAVALGDFSVLTACVHYEFWDERKPEAFVSFSPVRRVAAGAGFDRKSFVRELERQTEAQLDALLNAAQRRDATLFTPLLRSRSGVSPTYDALRTLSARLRGGRPDLDHGDVRTPPWKNRPEPKPK